MRLLLALILIGGGSLAPAQTPTPAAGAAQPAAAAPSAQDPAKPAEKPAAAAPAAQDPAKPAEKPAESPAPAAEQWLTGSFDFGYRWLTDVQGNFQQYRSVTNLGEGPKLFGLEFTIQHPRKQLFDRLDARAHGWGGDPYNTAHVAARKQGIYDFNFDYRNIAYFNAVPSFSNPFLPGGFNQQSFDLRRRNTSFSLDLLPGRTFTPYLAFERNSGYGRGINTWVQETNNEFAVPTLFRDSTNNYRGGLRFAFRNRFHLTLEQGGTTFKGDDQAFFQGVNLGDRTTPILGQTELLTGLSQAYGIRGTSLFSKVLVTARPVSWLDVHAQYLYSRPRTDVRFNDLAYGNFAQIGALLFYSGQQTLATGIAVQPHNSANVGFELRPFRRLRIVESWITDRYHNAASPFVATQLIFRAGTPNQNQLESLNYKQIVIYNQQQIDAFFDVTSKLTLRGGYRYVWGDSTVLAGTLSQSGSLASGELKRRVGLAGLAFRPFQKLSINVDYETASSDRIYFRTSLNDYHKTRARARFQATKSLSFQANFQALHNENPSPDIRYDFESRDNALSVLWSPWGGKRITLMGEYNRSSLHSDIRYLAVFLAPATSSYRERAHTATSALDITLPRSVKVTAGGSLFISSGSRATTFYQPLTRLSVPLHKRVYWNTEWQYYGFGEQFYLFEGFRTHVFMTGLRITQ